MKELAPTDVYAYGEYVFGYRPAVHHREMVDFIDSCVEDRVNGVVLEPRGHAKTTWGNTIWLSHYIAEHPNVRVGLVSNTARQSADFSRAIRWTLEQNDNFREIYGDCVSPSKWTDVEWLHKESKHHGSKDVTLYAQGVGGAIISKRFDLVICDDILDDENSLNVEAREKTEQWFWKTLKPCLAANGVIVVLGTRWAEEDLYERLINGADDGGKGWRSLVRGALTADGTKALWPEEWPVEKLEAEREDGIGALRLCLSQ